MTASADGRYVATGAADGTIIIWSWKPPSQKAVMEIQCPATSGNVCSLHFSDTGDFLAGVCTLDLLIWRVVDGAQITSITGHGEMRFCAWRRHGIDDLTISVWRSGAHAVSRFPYLSVTKAHVHSSGKVTTTTPVSVLPDEIPAVYDNSFERGYIAQSSSGSCFTVWDSTLSECFFWRILESIPIYETYQLDSGHPYSSPSCACFVGDTELVVGFCDGTIRWWDISSYPLTTPKPCVILPLFPKGFWASDLSVSPLHSFLVALCGRAPMLLRRTNARTARSCVGDRFALHVVLRGHTDWVNTACFSPCERYIATTSEDCTVRLWRTSNGELIWTFEDHDAEVKHLIFASDGRTLASADVLGRVCMHTLSMFIRDAPFSSVDDI